MSSGSPWHDADRTNQGNTLSDLIGRRRQNEQARAAAPPQAVPESVPVQEAPAQEAVFLAAAGPPPQDEPVVETPPESVSTDAVVAELKLLRAEVALLRQLIQKGVSNL